MKDSIKKNAKKQAKAFRKYYRKMKRSLRLFLLIVIVLLVFISSLFVFWFLKPSKKMYISVLDKTVPATAADSHSYLDNVDNVYRKHIGLNWILNYMKIKNPDTKKKYDYTKDYYGYMLNDNYEVQQDEKVLDDINEIPDILYLADAYGTEITEDKGITGEDMNAIALCRSLGSVVIGEQDILGVDNTEKSISLQLQKMFGITETGWVGRYIYDLADMDDVPYWAPDMYKQKYGVEWRCSGSGILLVSNDGDIIVLEGKTDFEDDNLLKIKTAKDYKSEFGKKSLNYYAWFELIEANPGTETLAQYEFNLNSTGMEEFAPVSDSNTFAAVVRNPSGAAPTYYFAGDFNDYVDDMKMSCFLGADTFYRSLSFENNGDITNFYWQFYEPMVKKIVKNAYKNRVVEHNTGDEAGQQSDAEHIRLNNDKLEVQTDGQWKTLSVKGFNLNAEAPGSNRLDYSTDFSFYEQLFAQLDEIGANAVRAYDLYPPEFYRALYEHNKENKDKIIYLYQGITAPDGIDKGKITDSSSIEQLHKNIEYTVDAIHGKGEIPEFLGRNSGKYRHNVSNYLAAYFVDLNMTDAQLKNAVQNLKYNYNGKYLSANKNSVEALLADLCDYLLKYQQEKYSALAIVAAKGSTAMLGGAMWQEDNSVTFNVSDIAVKDEAKAYFAAAYTAKYSDTAYQSNKKKFGTTDLKKCYELYLKEIKDNSKLPVFIDSFGASTSVNVFETETDIYGLTEEKQAQYILDMYKSINSGGFVGGLVADLNDSWAAIGQNGRKYTVPLTSSGLWHDVTDISQTTGILSVESIQPEEAGLLLQENKQRMNEMQISCNETYLYLTIGLDTEVNYDSEQLYIGFDTYQRNDGEYYYDKNFFGNALSGMEFIIKFESKNSAALYCASSYNRNKGATSSKESYSASYDFVSVLSYGSFSSQNTQFFTTGNSVRVRLPWAMLNFTDPARSIVINDPASTPSGADNQYKTTMTDGIICSVFIGDKKSKDTMYVFPVSKQSAGYKAFKWSEWEQANIKYALDQKASFDTLKKYFTTY